MTLGWYEERTPGLLARLDHTLRMNAEQLRQLFDDAFAAMGRGDFARAARCFERVIQFSPDPRARLIADRDLQWWCLPVVGITDALKRAGRPCNIDDLLPQAVRLDLVGDGAGYEHYTKGLFEKLAAVPALVRVGDREWVLATDMLRCAEYCVARVVESNSPALIEDLIRSFWPDCTDTEPSFPERLCTRAVASYVCDHVTVLANTYAATTTVLDAAVVSAHGELETRGVPLDLVSFLGDLWPDIPREIGPDDPLVRLIGSRLVRAAIEISPGVYLDPRTLQLSPESARRVFADLHPRSTSGLVASCSWFRWAAHDVTTRSRRRRIGVCRSTTLDSTGRQLLAR